MKKTVEIKIGDSLEVLRGLESDSIDAVVTDPPYGWAFMGKHWDYNVPDVEVWKEVLRVLKPGGHALVACGTRTQHRMAVNIEDAGFEIRDVVAWVHGQGFSKGKNIGNGMNTQLKPAMELWTLARKPLIGTVVDNVLEHGTGGLNIDGCRVPTNPDVDDRRLGGNGSWKTDKAAKNVYEGGYSGVDIKSSAGGRYPANFIHDGSEEVVSLFPETKSGDSKGFIGDYKAEIFGKYANNVINPDTVYADAGSAARFFYCAKASKSERSQGTDGNNHPTVKPIELMRYLCRLITPPGGLILDPYMGSGTTGCAAVLEGFNFLGIDREQEYAEIAEARIKHYNSKPEPLF